MNVSTKTIALITLAIVFLFLWAPWLTDEYVVNRLMEKLGGSEARFVYLGQDMTIKDIPKKVTWFPFCRFVSFPGEAGWFVTFYGTVA